MGIHIVEDRAGYVLVNRGDRFAVIERRAGHFYNLHGGARCGIDCDPEKVPEIVDENDWVDEAKARAQLTFAVRRHDELAERMW
jgi:hypothetical protein